MITKLSLEMRLLILLSCLAFVAKAKGNCLEYNTDYDGTNINNGFEQRTDNAEDCQKLCQFTTNCEAFTWASSHFHGNDLQEIQ